MGSDLDQLLVAVGCAAGLVQTVLLAKVRDGTLDGEVCGLVAGAQIIVLTGSK